MTPETIEFVRLVREYHAFADAWATRPGNIADRDRFWELHSKLTAALSRLTKSGDPTLLDAEDPMLDIRKAVASTLRRMPLPVNSDKEFTDCVIDLLPDYFRQGVIARLTKSGGQGELDLEARPSRGD